MALPGANRPMQRLEGRLVYPPAISTTTSSASGSSNSRRSSLVALGAPRVRGSASRAPPPQGRRSRTSLPRPDAARAIPAASWSSNAPRAASSAIGKPSSKRWKLCDAARRSSIRRRSSMAGSSATPISCAASKSASDLGEYGYEVIDTKLGLSAEAVLPGAALQLQRAPRAAARHDAGVRLRRLRQRRGAGFRLHDYMAYYRHLKAAFLELCRQSDVRQRPAAARVSVRSASTARICPWNDASAQQRADDDHLSLVAWMRRDQIAKLEAAGITRVTRAGNRTDDAAPERA